MLVYTLHLDANIKTRTFFLYKTLFGNNTHNKSVFVIIRHLIYYTILYYLYCTGDKASSVFELLSKMFLTFFQEPFRKPHVPETVKSK